jgi:hypothetical protein
MIHQVTSVEGSYTQELTKKRGFKYIGVSSRSELMDFLLGRTDDCNGLVRDVFEGRKRLKMSAEPLLDTVTAGSSAKRARAVADAVIRDVSASEEISFADVAARVRPVKDLDVLVRSPGRTVPNVDLILRIAQEECRLWQSGSAVSAVPMRPVQPSTDKLPLKGELELYLSKNPDAHPIILVPCNKYSPINLLNVHGFLQNGTWAVPEDERLRFFESTRPEHVEVTRTLSGRSWTFEVRDVAVKLTREQWLRTVCVISDGSDWQFKGWPFETTVDIFTTLQGFFFQENLVPRPTHVKEWQVHVLAMPAYHLDHRFGQLRDEFFVVLESFFNKLRSKKFKNDTYFEPAPRVFMRERSVL